MTRKKIIILTIHKFNFTHLLSLQDNTCDADWI